MDPEEALMTVEEAMQKSVDHATQQFSSIRTGKASPALVEGLNVNVPSYGSVMKLQSLAVTTTPEPRMLMVSPHDPSTVKDIEKAIRESNLGLNPVNEGNKLRLPIPELSEERRRELVKTVKGMAEDAKVSLRGSRKDGMTAGKKMKADNVLNEDQLKDFEASVQELTDSHVKKVDELLEAKEKEVMTV